MTSEPPRSPYLVPFDGSFRVDDAPTAPPSYAPDRRALERQLEDCTAALRDCARLLQADGRYSVLLVLQGLDGSGKDSTIRAVTRGVSAARFQVVEFNRPSAEELSHDFLWRTARRLPERGKIGVFNRSHYEEVLTARVHPELLEPQRLPASPAGEAFWEQRFESIREHERHLAMSGTLVLKCWLHVSSGKQAKRLLRRIDRPDKWWKLDPDDVRERDYRDAYLRAYEAALNATSRPWAPWYAIPADKKPFMRATVADLLVRALKGLDLRYPAVDDLTRMEMQRLRPLLEQ